MKNINPLGENFDCFLAPKLRKENSMSNSKLIPTGWYRVVWVPDGQKYKFYRYENHIKTDRRARLIRKYTVNDASVQDS